jgi:hypothetical protein
VKRTAKDGLCQEQQARPPGGPSGDGFRESVCEDGNRNGCCPASLLRQRLHPSCIPQVHRRGHDQEDEEHGRAAHCPHPHMSNAVSILRHEPIVLLGVPRRQIAPLNIIQHSARDHRVHGREPRDRTLQHRPGVTLENPVVSVRQPARNEEQQEQQPKKQRGADQVRNVLEPASAGEQVQTLSSGQHAREAEYPGRHRAQSAGDDQRRNHEWIQRQVGHHHDWMEHRWQGIERDDEAGRERNQRDGLRANDLRTRDGQNAEDGRVTSAERQSVPFERRHDGAHEHRRPAEDHPVGDSRDLRPGGGLERLHQVFHAHQYRGKQRDGNDTRGDQRQDLVPIDVRREIGFDELGEKMANEQTATHGS